MIAIRPGYFAIVKFPLGQCLATPGALEALDQSGETPAKFLQRHLAGDWGCVCNDDKKLNDEALIDGSRLVSSYRTSKGVKLWIITEAADDSGNRAATTLLLPEEY
jgi:hypothetical protein